MEQRILAQIPVEGGAIVIHLLVEPDGEYVDIRRWQGMGQEMYPTGEGCRFPASSWNAVVMRNAAAELCDRARFFEEIGGTLSELSNA